MPAEICKNCGLQMFHENQTTLDIEIKIHKKFCRKELGESHSYMHRDLQHMDTFDAERAKDGDGAPILK